MLKEVKIKIDQDMIRRLVRMVQGDTDSADKHALDYILWNIAEQIGIVDSNGNLTSNYQESTMKKYQKKSQLNEMTNMGFKTLSDELNIDDVNDQLAQVKGLGFTLHVGSSRPQPIRSGMQGPLRIEDINESVARITNGMDGLFESKEMVQKKVK